VTFTVSSSSGLNTEHKHFFNNIFICVLRRFSDSAKISKKGKYGYEVEWADDATIIYSLLAIAKAVGGKPIESRHSEVGVCKADKSR